MIPLLLIAHTKKALRQFLEKRNVGEKTITITLQPLSSEYSIDQIREIQKEVSIQQPIKRIYIFEEFDKASLEAQNAFLKLLEEPPENVEFILVVENQYTLLSTLVSRTKIIRVEKEIIEKKETAVSRKLSIFAVKKTLSSLDFSTFTASSKEDAVKILMEMLSFFRERLLDDTAAPKIIKEILHVCKLIKNNNLNSQLALDHLLIFIAKAYNLYNSYNDYKNYKK